MSWLNNLAFAFHISQPMHMVFRSSNLMISFIFGWAVKGKRYTSGQLVAVTLLTLGAGLATMAEARVGDTAAAAANLGGGCGGCGSDPLPSLEMNAAGAAYMWTWGTGVAILTAVLLLQTLLGSRQDDSSKLYGHAPFEAMFYMHTLSLPVLLLLGGRDFSGSIAKWSASPRADTVVASLVADAGTGSAARAAGAAFLWLSGALSPLRLDFASLPVLWLQVAANVATQWVCLMGVYSLIAAADQLTVNVILTLRKFVSLMLSIALFGNTFTTYHWVGSVAVFGGAALFSASGSGSTPAKAGEAVNRVKGARKGSQGSAKRDRSPARLARKKAS
jgi:UDP-xylose/UDP-N-acetylglucosamine transporter B4